VNEQRAQHAAPLQQGLDEALAFSVSLFPHVFSGGSTVLTTGGMRTGPPIKVTLCECFVWAGIVFNKHRKPHDVSERT